MLGILGKKMIITRDSRKTLTYHSVNSPGETRGRREEGGREGGAARGFGSREISSAPLFALGHGRRCPADDRTTITNASRRACTRASVAAGERAGERASGRVHTLGSQRLSSSRSSPRRGRSRRSRRSSNPREIQNKRSRRLRAIATGSRDSVGGHRRRAAPRRITAHALHLRCTPVTTDDKPPAHARRGLTS